jgi:type III secretory pathway component EscV
MTARAVWECALGIAGLLYLALALFKGIESPVFAILFVMLALLELVTSYRTRHKQ